MIRQPGFVTPAVFEDREGKAFQKEAGARRRAWRGWTYTEGLCVQAMHIGPYDAEPATVKAHGALPRAAGIQSGLSRANAGTTKST